ncbi:hypothetical protein [Salana multivorans]
MRTKDAEQRYRELLANRPSLIGRVSQRDLASYLNITESALSRIVRRVRENDAAAQAAAEVANPDPEPVDDVGVAEVVDLVEVAESRSGAATEQAPITPLGRAAEA